MPNTRKSGNAGVGSVQSQLKKNTPSAFKNSEVVSKLFSSPNEGTLMGFIELFENSTGLPIKETAGNMTVENLVEFKMPSGIKIPPVYNLMLGKLHKQLDTMIGEPHEHSGSNIECIIRTLAKRVKRVEQNPEVLIQPSPSSPNGIPSPVLIQPSPSSPNGIPSPVLGGFASAGGCGCDAAGGCGCDAAGGCESAGGAGEDAPKASLMERIKNMFKKKVKKPFGPTTEEGTMDEILENKKSLRPQDPQQSLWKKIKAHKLLIGILFAVAAIITIIATIKTPTQWKQFLVDKSNALGSMASKASGAVKSAYLKAKSGVDSLIDSISKNPTGGKIIQILRKYGFFFIGVVLLAGVVIFVIMKKDWIKDKASKAWAKGKEYASKAKEKISNLFKKKGSPSPPPISPPLKPEDEYSFAYGGNNLYDDPEGGFISYDSYAKAQSSQEGQTLLWQWVLFILMMIILIIITIAGTHMLIHWAGGMKGRSMLVYGERSY